MLNTMAFGGQEDSFSNSTASENGYELADVPLSNSQRHTDARVQSEYPEAIDETSFERSRVSQAANHASREFG